MITSNVNAILETICSLDHADISLHDSHSANLEANVMIKAIRAKILIKVFNLLFMALLLWRFIGLISVSIFRLLSSLLQL